MFKDWQESLIKSIISSFSGFDGHLSGAYSLLTEDIFSGNWGEIANAISNIIKPTALIIAGICFLIEFLKIIVNADILKWENALKVGAKLCIAKASIDISSEFLRLIYTTVAGWIEAAGLTFSSGAGSSLATSAKTALEKYSFGEVLGAYLASFIFIMFLNIVAIMVKVMSYGRAFELTCVNAVAPLPFAFLCLDDGGGSRVTKTYIFAYISICLRGLFMVISMSIYTKLASGIEFTNWLDGLSELLMVSLVLLMALVKSDQWAKQLFNG